MSQQNTARSRTTTEIALDFLQQVASGTIRDDILASDFSAWTASFGDMSGDDYRKACTILTAVLKEPLRTTPTAVTAQDERVAVEAVSQGTLITGESYSNNYHFLVIVKDGRVSRVKAYFNTQEAAAKLSPLFNKVSPEYRNRAKAAGSEVANPARK